MRMRCTRNQRKAGALGIVVFILVSSGLSVLTRDVSFALAAGFILGLGAFDLTLVLSNLDSDEA